MRIVACVAAVPDPAKVAWDRMRQALDLQAAEPVLNPADRGALELAARLAAAAGATFDALSAGSGARSALREAAAFGASELRALEDPALNDADEAGFATALSAAMRVLRADVVFCGAATSSFGSGSVPGRIAAELGFQIAVDALTVEPREGGIRITCVGRSEVRFDELSFPAVIVAAPFGISVRALSPIALVKASKKAVLTTDLAGVGGPLSLPRTAAAIGGLESNRTRRAAAVVEGADAPSRAAALLGVLREKHAI